MQEGLLVRTLGLIGLVFLTNACKNHPPGQRAEAGAGPEAALEGDGLGAADPHEAGPSDIALTDAAVFDLDRDSTASAIFRLSEVVVYADCMPTYPPKTDPIIASWMISIEAAGRSSATLRDATLTIVSSRSDVLTMLTQHLAVDATTVPLSGGAGSMQQTKTGADSSSSSACMSLCTNATWSLDLTFDLGTVHASGPFSCPM